MRLSGPGVRPQLSGCVNLVHFVVATLATATVEDSREGDFANACATVRAAKSAPKAKRITGPKLIAAETPTK